MLSERSRLRFPIPEDRERVLNKGMIDDVDVALHDYSPTPSG